MFGYVMPCKMELKIRDYERFKAYYCGLCKSLKKQYGHIPRFLLNYDMTFLALLLDSLEKNKIVLKKENCIAHPINKRWVIYNNEAIDYAASVNLLLAHYKFLDDVEDENSIKGKAMLLILKPYYKKHSNSNLEVIIKERLSLLYNQENNYTNGTMDEVSHNFGDLTGTLLKAYIEDKKDFDDLDRHNLYWLGYYLGKWIYIIDALDDLEEDIKNHRFNAINSVFNKQNESYQVLINEIKDRIELLLTSTASLCHDYLGKLPLNKNKELVDNILSLGLMEKIHKVALCEKKKSKENF